MLPDMRHTKNLIYPCNNVRIIIVLPSPDCQTPLFLFVYVVFRPFIMTATFPYIMRT